MERELKKKIYIALTSLILTVALFSTRKESHSSSKQMKVLNTKNTLNFKPAKPSWPAAQIKKVKPQPPREIEKDRIEALKAMELSENEVVKSLKDQGFEDIRISYDKNGLMQIDARGEKLDPETVQENMDQSWEKSESELIVNLNGGELNLTDEDKEMIELFKANNRL